MQSANDIRARLKKLRDRANHPTTPKHEAEACAKKASELEAKLAALPRKPAAAKAPGQNKTYEQQLEQYYKQMRDAEMDIDAQLRAFNAQYDAQMRAFNAQYDAQMRAVEQQIDRDIRAQERALNEYFAQYEKNWARIVAMHNAAERAEKAKKKRRFKLDDIGVLYICMLIFLSSIFIAGLIDLIIKSMQ